MADMLDRMKYISQGGDEGRALGLNQLVGQAYNADPAHRQALLGRVASQGEPGMALAAGKSFDDQSARLHADLAQRAKLVVGLYQANSPMAQQAYASMLPIAAQAGFPQAQQHPQLDDSLIPGLQKLASALDPQPQGGVHSAFRGQNGNMWVLDKDGIARDTGAAFDPNSQIIDTGNGFFGVNKTNLQAAPVMTGQPGAQGQPRAPGEVPFSIDPSLPPEVQADIRANESQYAGAPDGAQRQIPSAPGATMPGQQLRSAPKPQAEPEESFGTPQTVIGPDGKPALVQFGNRGGQRPVQGFTDAPKGQTPAQQAKMQTTARKERMMLAANDAAVDQTVALIDSIVARKDDLSGVTGMGRVGSMIPGTDWADLAAKLDTLKGRSAFGALQQMRANSPTGGALGQVSERELYLLQNAETQLQNSQSPESLVQSLGAYRQALLDSKRRMHDGVSEFYTEQGVGDGAQAQGGHVDDLLSKYGVQ